VADDALIDQMELRIGARASNAAGIKHLVADLEQGGLRPRLDDDPGRIPADHFRDSLWRRRGGAHLVIHRVHRNGAHVDQEVASRG
jgi:hypothetical protein